VGEEGIALQKDGVGVAFWAKEYQGSNDELLSDYLDMLENEYDSLQVLPAESVMVARDLPGLLVRFSGSFDGWREEGELVVTTSAGVGMGMWARANPGQMAWAQVDQGRMLDGLEVPR
jgi:hypothetical protein